MPDDQVELIRALLKHAYEEQTSRNALQAALHTPAQKIPPKAAEKSGTQPKIA
jgi:hypothetical protein